MGGGGGPEGGLEKLLEGKKPTLESQDGPWPGGGGGGEGEGERAAGKKIAQC